MTRLAWPLRPTSSGRLATVQSGTPAALAQDARLLLSTVVDERICQPGYGRPDWSFRRGGVTAEEVLTTLSNALDVDTDVVADALLRDPAAADAWTRVLGLSLSSLQSSEGA